MLISNPGNFVPCYPDPRWQRHRQIGQDTPFGLPAPSSRLLPMQAYFPTGGLSALSFVLVNARNEEESLAQSASLLEAKENSTGGYWITWKADQNLTQVPECGYWYAIIGNGSRQFFFEVLHLKPNASFDRVGLALEDNSCDFSAGTLTFGILAADQLTNAATEQTIEYFDNSEWQTVGETGGTIAFQDFPPNSIQVRRIVLNSMGVTLVATYTVTWDDADPCASLALNPVSSVNSGGTVAEVWRLRATNSGDKGTTLYQTGYEQQLFIEPIFDVPETERETEITENGFGDEVTRTSRSAEKIAFEVRNLPDYLLHPLAMLGDLSDVILETVGGEHSFGLVNTSFAHRKQSPALNIGEFKADRRIEVFTNCQPNFSLVE